MNFEFGFICDGCKERVTSLTEDKDKKKYCSLCLKKRIKK